MLGLSLVLGWVAGAPAGGDGGSLAELNERWQGARCRILLNVPIKKGHDSDGWSRSIWIVPRNEGAGLGGARLSVSDRARVTSNIPDSTTPEGFRLKGGPGVPRGTAFIAEGWEYQNPEKRSGLVLNLRFAKKQASARMTFRGKKGGQLNRDAVDDAERWARIELFELRPADESLVEVPASAGSGMPAPSASRSAQPSRSADVRLRILGVAAEPLRVGPGSEVVLSITYSISGVPANQTVEVLEKRRILRDGEILTTLEARAVRPPGTHESSQPVRIPAAVASGVYTVQAVVETGGVSAEGSTMFQVSAGAD